MIRNIKYFIFLLPLLITAAVFSQPTGNQNINPNGYNKFYYDNGKVSSEGNMKNGKPDGYWKTYLPNGKMKSEGNRKNFLLDSTWKFYDDNGSLSSEINYKAGKKEGAKKHSTRTER
jgi:antitoxin component YwqK of YwqJK toxin-antitoxin module